MVMHIDSIKQDAASYSPRELSRRRLFQAAGGIGLLAGGAAMVDLQPALAADAASGHRASQVPALNRRRIGEFLVTAISDGYLEASVSLLSHIDAATASAMMTDAGITAQSVMNINTYVVQGRGHTILIDAGAGGFSGWGGHLATSLVAAGVDPSEIDTILMTHAHPDHAGGLAGELGFSHFRNAEFVLNQSELAFWQDDENLSRAPASAQPAFRVARNAFDAFKGRTRTFVKGAEVLPGITAYPLPGHTIGHTGYMIESEGQSLLVWGDIVHYPDIQVARPDVTIAFDSDPSMAAQTRLKVLDMVSTENLLIAGMHLNMPSFARIKRQGNGYQIRKEEWAPSVI
jgi:glyoxylase-like metal-dependent hydrolase (beta-lactamase superfamily II)